MEHNIHEHELEENLNSYLGTSITSDESQKALEWMKNGKSPGGDNINSESHKWAQEEFKLRLLQF